MVSHPETGSDSPIGSDRDRGRDITPTLKSKFNSPFLTSLKSFVRRKPIPVFDPRPLYCSSLTTAVGGI